MGISFASVISLLSIITPAIETAEKYIRGRKRGAEKKDAVVAQTLEHITDIANAALQEVEPVGPTGPPGEMTGVRRYNWGALLLSLPELSEKIGRVVDALVDLFNFLRRFEKKEPANTIIN